MKKYRTVKVPLTEKNDRGYRNPAESVFKTIEKNIQPDERVVSVYVVEALQDQNHWIYAYVHEILFERDEYDYREKA